MSNEHAQYISKVESMATDAGFIVHEVNSMSMVSLREKEVTGVQPGEYACISVSLLIPVKQNSR